jgi:hypothetical protein
VPRQFTVSSFVRPEAPGLTAVRKMDIPSTPTILGGLRPQ